MTENEEQVSDDAILERAQEIRKARKIGFSEAIAEAEVELRPKPAVPRDFTVTIPVKPRVASWIQREFAPVDGFTTEERLAAYLETVLNRSRIQAIRQERQAPDIREGSAVTLTRDQFQKQAPQ